MGNLIPLDTKAIGPHVREIDAEGVLDNEGNLVNPATYEQLDQFKFNGDKLKVDATLVAEDIEIGAVEIKNATTDDRMKVHTDGSIDVNVSSGVPAVVGIKDASDVRINPAKEDGNLASILTQLDITTSALRNAITGTSPNNATLFDLLGKLTSILGQLDVALSTRNAEATQLLVKAKTDNLDVLLSTRASEATLLLVKAKTDNLDVLLSTRATEATLALIKAKTDNLDVLLSTRASETTLGGVKTQTDKLQFDGSNNLKVTASTIGTVKSYWQVATEAGKGYVTSTNTVTVSGTAEVPFILVKNPIGSGKTVKIYMVSHGINETQGTPRHTLRIYRDPTVTVNGTAQAINNLLKSGGATAVNAFLSPTISANGTFLLARTGSQIIVPFEIGLGMFIQPGENILFTVKNQTTNYENFLSIYWIEE